MWLQLNLVRFRLSLFISLHSITSTWPVPVGPNRDIQPPPSVHVIPLSMPKFLVPSPFPKWHSHNLTLTKPSRLTTPQSYRHPRLPTSCHFSPFLPLASSRHAGVVQFTQAPPSQVPVHVQQTPAPMAPVPQSSAQKLKPPPRRQYHGPNSLQVDLEDSREKERATTLAAVQQKSGSAARPSLGHVSAALAPNTVTHRPHQLQPVCGTLQRRQVPYPCHLSLQRLHQLVQPTYRSSTPRIHQRRQLLVLLIVT